MSILRVAILGAGGRGQGFSSILGNRPHRAKVVGVAEPRDAYREKVAKDHGLDPKAQFKGWRDFLAAPKFADAVVIATMDREHREPAVACLEKGYHVLLEKPMAVTLEDCRLIEAAQRRSGKVVAVCHSLRYHKAFRKLRDLASEGRLGRLITLDQLEQVGYWHQAHSFVRGNWANQGRSSFMLMAKSCHDIDYIAYLVGKPCLRVSSFGALTHFKADQAPPGATDRCTDGCPAENSCPYSAVRLYAQGDLNRWPANTIGLEHTMEAHMKALREGPYGRCVYKVDNDVVDHQVVTMEFADDITATFTMTGFTQDMGRKIRVHGTAGDAEFDEGGITLKTYGTTRERIDFAAESGGHGGGDDRVVDNWLDAVEKADPTLALANAQESLRTHTIVFAAEKARLERRVVELSEFSR